MAKIHIDGQQVTCILIQLITLIISLYIDILPFRVHTESIVVFTEMEKLQKYCTLNTVIYLCIIIEYIVIFCKIRTYVSLVQY